VELGFGKAGGATGRDDLKLVHDTAERVGPLAGNNSMSLGNLVEQSLVAMKFCTQRKIMLSFFFCGEIIFTYTV
jgi:hypothetical protein